jgi:hypothetical protein
LDCPGEAYCVINGEPSGGRGNEKLFAGCQPNTGPTLQAAVTQPTPVPASNLVLAPRPADPGQLLLERLKEEAKSREAPGEQ